MQTRLQRRVKHFGEAFPEFAVFAFNADPAATPSETAFATPRSY
jgi:hypothetical protein